MTYITYIGSYTDKTHIDGIHIFESNADTGDFRALGVLNTMESPIYMAINRDCTRLYSVLGRPEFGPRGRNGGIAAFAIQDERLELINEIPTGWTIPCHISLDPWDESLVYAEYSCGTAGYANLADDGSIDPSFASAPGKVNPLCQVRHSGEGPNKPRQDSAHAHCAVVTPDGKYMMVVDLTLDRIVAYDYVNRSGGLKEVPDMSIDTRRIMPGAGPRHLVFHPSGDYAFVIYELGNLVSCFRYTDAGFEHVMTKSTLPYGCSNFSKAAALKVSEDGGQVFCTNRGHDSITVFNFDQQTGGLDYLNNTKLNGQFPRDFEFMPGGRFALVGLKESWRIASFAYNRKTGEFTEVVCMDGIYRPLFFAFRGA